MKNTRPCKCGGDAKYIEYVTFSYYYCDVCKVEVSEAPPQSPGEELLEILAEASKLGAATPSITNIFPYHLYDFSYFSIKSNARTSVSVVATSQDIAIDYFKVTYGPDVEYLAPMWVTDDSGMRTIV